VLSVQLIVDGSNVVREGWSRADIDGVKLVEHRGNPGIVMATTLFVSKAGNNDGKRFIAVVFVVVVGRVCGIVAVGVVVNGRE